MKRIYYWLCFWLLEAYYKWQQRKHIKSVRKRVFNTISKCYANGQDDVAFCTKQEFDIAMDIVSKLGIWKSWNHDGVFYVIHFDGGDEKDIH